MHWLKKTGLGVAVIAVLFGAGWQATKRRDHFLFLRGATLMDEGIMHPTTDSRYPDTPIEYRVYAVKEPFAEVALHVDRELAGKGFTRRNFDSWDQETFRVDLDAKTTRESGKPLLWARGEPSSEWTRITIVNAAPRNVFTSIRAYFFAGD